MKVNVVFVCRILIIVHTHVPVHRYAWIITDLHVYIHVGWHRFAWAGSGMVSLRLGIGCGRWTYWAFMQCTCITHSHTTHHTYIKFLCTSLITLSLSLSLSRTLTHTHIPVVLVVSSSCSDPLESFSKLFTKQRQSEQGKHPKWITPHVYYYHVLLHDSSSCPEARWVVLVGNSLWSQGLIWIAGSSGGEIRLVPVLKCYSLCTL